MTATQPYIPWGRTFEEYLTMFSLTDHDLSGRILGCSDGPSAFNSELTQRGGDVVSIDALYQFTSEQIRKLIDETYPEAIKTFHRKKALFVWKNLKSVHKLGRMRLSAMNDFLADLEWGKREGRYIHGALSTMPLVNREFDIALCSHHLFTHTAHLTTQFHAEAIQEMARVAHEVRIFPILENGAILSRHLLPTISSLRNAGYRVRIEPVDYEFMAGGNQMLRVSA